MVTIFIALGQALLAGVIGVAFLSLGILVALWVSRGQDEQQEEEDGYCRGCFRCDDQGCPEEEGPPSSLPPSW